MIDPILIFYFATELICVEPHVCACSDLYIDFNLMFVLS
jgi:hypothetical protein